MPSSDAQELRDRILEMVREYHALAHAKKPFEPGRSRINYSGRVYDDREMVNLAAAALDFWLTLGPYGEKLETRMQSFFGARDFVLTPGLTWHDHGVESDGTQCIWQDGLDIPMMNALDGNSFEVHKDTVQTPAPLSRENWKKPPLRVERGVLAKYARTVNSASEGATTS